MLSGGVADGLAGGISTSVGVGTGGSANVGGALDGLVAPGTPVPGASGTADVGGGVLADSWLGGEDDAPASGRGGREAYPTVVTGPDVAAADCGAAPIPPAPLGAPADGRAGGGVPSSHPVVSATGSPSATMPKKTHLGESCTQRTGHEGAKSYGGLAVQEGRDPGAQFAPVVPEHRGPVVDVQPGSREQRGESFRDRSRMKVVA